MAAHKKDINQVKERPISFRLMKHDKLRLLEVAAARGLTPGQLAREIIARDVGLNLSAPQVRRAVANAGLLREILGELGRQGNNLNQIALHLNQGGIRADAADDLSKVREAYEHALVAIIAALKRSRS